MFTENRSDVAGDAVVEGSSTAPAEKAVASKSAMAEKAKHCDKVLLVRVGDFFEAFEGVVGLANNAKGMNAPEKIVALRACLKGSRRKVFDIIDKRHGKARDDDTAATIYKEVKARLLQFMETSQEQQLRVNDEWEKLVMTKHMTPYQFEARWEEIMAEREECGLPSSELQKFLDYIRKIGHLGERVRQDRRPRDDGSGGLETRTPKTWKEAHAVIVEMEQFKRSTAAFAGHHSRRREDDYVSGAVGAQDGGKGKKKGICYLSLM